MTSVLAQNRGGQLLDSDQVFRLLVQSVQDYAIYLLDADGRVATWNEGAQRMKGYRAEEIIGQPISAFFLPEDVEAGRPEQELKTAAELGRTEDENWRVRKDGSKFWAGVTLTALRDPKGKLVGFAKITRDLSRQKKSEEDLRRAHEDLERRVTERTADLARANEEIAQQSREILELSMPVVSLFKGLAMVPLIGTLDSRRTQMMMELLLNYIVEHSASIALVDITGVPTVDTQTARHLIETISAVRLLGADVVLTGVRPAIAQSLVHLGIDLAGVTTRASVEAGLKLAMERLGLKVVGSDGEGAA